MKEGIMLTRSKSKRKFEEEKKDADSVSVESEGKAIEASSSSATLEEQIRQIEEEAKASVSKKQKVGEVSSQKEDLPESLQVEQKEQSQSTESNGEKESAAVPTSPANGSIRSILSQQHLDELYEIMKKKQTEERQEAQSKTSEQNQPQQIEEEAKKPAALEHQKGSVRNMINEQIQKQNYDEQLSLPQQGDTNVIGGHVAALQNPAPVARRPRKTIIGDDDLEVIYNFVLNGGNEKDLSYSQRIYHKGLMADSFNQVQIAADKHFKGDKEQMSKYVDYSQEQAKKEFEAGNSEKAVMAIVDSRAMQAMVDSIEQDKNSSIIRQATNVMAI